MNIDKLNLKSVGARLKQKTPPFWAKLRKWMIGCGALGAALYAVPAEHMQWIPHKLQNLDSILITIGVVGATLSSLTVKDTELSAGPDNS